MLSHAACGIAWFVQTIPHGLRMDLTVVQHATGDASNRETPWNLSTAAAAQVFNNMLPSDALYGKIHC